MLPLKSLPPLVFYDASRSGDFPRSSGCSGDREGRSTSEFTPSLICVAAPRPSLLLPPLPTLLGCDPTEWSLFPR